MFAGISAGILLFVLPVRLQIIRSDDTFRMTISVSFFRVGKTGIPHQKRRKKELPNRKILLILIKNGYPILCRLLRRIEIDELTLHFTAAFSNPAVTAMVYAVAGIVMDELYRIRPADKTPMDLAASVDFERPHPVVRMKVVVSIRLFRLVGAAVLFGAGVLRDLLRADRKGVESYGCASSGKPDDGRNG